MIIHLSPDRPPSIEEADRLDGLSARATGPIGTMSLAPTCRASDDDEHIWVEVAALRAANDAAGSGDGFDAMIEYARSKGWLDAAGTHVRAHIA